MIKIIIHHQIINVFTIYIFMTRGYWIALKANT